ncbi:hypothetical protein [Glutamicibacter halophytocola]|uniref:hypothetical protein n=1 Tax=Glutamicibacter halophytocola TaxID=1933880 RepID=UPI001C1302F1|nr:hypothetical protein [Glutamicibacter halophytocola]
MPGPIARTQTAVRVADFLATREGKSHLASYGWAPGMPIVMARSSEPLNDVMAMVSIHGQAVLVAMLDPRSDELRMLHITTPQSALRVVAPSPATVTIGEFFDRLSSVTIAEFRVKFWQNTAVAHVVPSCHAMQAPGFAGKRYQLPDPRQALASIGAE